MKFMKYLLTILVSLILSINLAIAEKWDMALAYGAGNFHSATAKLIDKINETKIVDKYFINFIFPPFFLNVFHYVLN